MPEFERLRGIFAALANEHRLALLDALHEAETCDDAGRSISELAAVTEMSRFVASHHLAILVSADLDVATRKGQRRVHRLNHSALREVEDWAYDTSELGPASSNFAERSAIASFALNVQGDGTIGKARSRE